MFGHAVLNLALAATCMAYISPDFQGTLTLEDQSNTPHDLVETLGTASDHVICGALAISPVGADPSVGIQRFLWPARADLAHGSQNKGYPFEIEFEQRSRDGNAHPMYQPLKTVPRPVWITDPNGKSGSFYIKPDPACADL